MVAIHIPRPADDEWALDPGEGPNSSPGLFPVPRRQAEPTRHLPDRATRVRRRRLAVLVVGVGLACGVTLGVQALAGLSEVGGTAGPEPVEVRPAPVAGQQYVVQPGDTLWSIAAEVAPDRDPRAVVDALREANGGPLLEVGTRLTLDLG